MEMDLKNDEGVVNSCEKTDVLCVVCRATSEQPYIDIYTTHTTSSRCLLSEFITKTTKIIFDRDKVWSKILCKHCYDLIIQLDEAETQYLKLKNDFIDVLSKNQLIEKLPKVGNNVIDNGLPILLDDSKKSDKIGFFDIEIKRETNEDANDFSPGPSPIVSDDDSDDEPLLGRSSKRKKKAVVDLLPDNMKLETVKCEFEEPPNVSSKAGVYSCRSCRLEFNDKEEASLHAFSAHSVDVAKKPTIIKVKSMVGKDGKKKKGRKRGKRKCIIDLADLDADNPDNDKDWTPVDVFGKQNSRAMRISKRNQDKICNTPILISPDSITIKPRRKYTSREAKNKLFTSGEITIKKISNSDRPSLSNPVPIAPLEDGSIVVKTEDKSDLIGSTDFLKVLQGRGTKVKMEKRPYVKKQKPALTCAQCPAVFTSQSRMDLHMVKHTGSLTPYICEICGAAYKHKKACDIHVEMHKGISPWKCSLCDKIFPSKGALCRHEAIHTGTPNYQCDLCGKSFIHTSSFKMHKLSHSGLKPHSCNKCGLALMTRSHLKRHQRVHSGEKRHECGTCGRKFSERYNLYAHQKSHDPTGAQVARQSKTHDCTVCEASFNRRYVLEKHMETAHQRVMDPLPKKTRNTMTKMLKLQALQNQQQHEHQLPIIQNTVSQIAGAADTLDVKLLITKSPPLHNADGTSTTAFISEAAFQHAVNTGQTTPIPTSLIVVTKQELPEGPTPEVTVARSVATSSASVATTSAVSSSSTAATVGLTAAAPAAVMWPGLYQLANEYPLRMHGLDYLGRSGN